MDDKISTDISDRALNLSKGSIRAILTLLFSLAFIGLTLFLMSCIVTKPDLKPETINVLVGLLAGISGVLGVLIGYYIGKSEK